MIRLLLVEDEATVRTGVRVLLNLEADFEVVGEAGNGQQAVELFSQLAPDIVLMDIRMPIMDGVEATKILNRDYPDSKVLIWTTFKEDELVVDALRSGAMGYLLKNDSSEALSAGIRATYRGCSTFSAGIVDADITIDNTGDSADASDTDLVELPEGFDGLTCKEKEVLRRLAPGESCLEISQHLYVTVGTVRNYLYKISDKLGVRGHTRLALLANKLLAAGVL